MEPNWLKLLEFFGETFAFIIMVVSLFGLIVPVFPGIFVIWLVALLSILIDGEGWVLFGFLTVLMVVGVLADNFLMGSKARQQGAAWESIGFALLAGVVGTVVLPPIGGIIAAPLVLYGLENRRLGNSEKAKEVVRALMIGWGWAFVARFLIGAVMVGSWGIWALFN